MVITNFVHIVVTVNVSMCLLRMLWYNHVFTKLVYMQVPENQMKGKLRLSSRACEYDTFGVTNGNTSVVRNYFVCKIWLTHKVTMNEFQFGCYICISKHSIFLYLYMCLN